MKSILPSHVSTNISYRKDFGRYCLPDLERVHELFNAAGLNLLGEWIMDLYTGWRVLLISIAVSIILTLIYLTILKCFTRALIWTSIAATILFLAALGFIFLRKCQEEANEDYAKIYKLLIIIFWSIDGLMILLVFCLYKDIKASLSVAETASSFMFGNLQILIVPALINIFAIVFIYYWIFTAISLLSTGNLSQMGITPFTLVDFTDSTLRNSLFYFIFAFFWIWAILMALNQFVIAATTIQWYFTEHSDTDGDVSILKSFNWAALYHTGSLAFGSFFVAVLSLVRVIFDFMRRQVMRIGKHNIAVRCILCCFAYCLKCIGECVLFMSKNSYVQVAIRSVSFCCAARESFRLMIRNATKFTIVNGFSSILTFFGKCSVGAGTAFLCYLILGSQPDLKEDLHAPSVLIVGCFTVGYTMGKIFLTVYDMSSTTILQCFLMDEETSEGEGKNRPKSLDSFMEEIRSSFITMDE
jgi:solute carrier family 44 protein 1 (choline transporter-like protein)